MKSLKVTGIAITMLLLASCGGSSGDNALGSGSLGGSSPYDNCTAPFFESLIGNFTGTVEVTHMNYDRSHPYHTCEWDIVMDWRGIANEINGLCSIKVDFQAVVTRLDSYGLESSVANCVAIDQTFTTYQSLFGDNDYIQSPTFPIDITLNSQSEVHPFQGLPDHLYITPINGDHADWGGYMRFTENQTIQPVGRGDPDIIITSSIHKQ